MNISILMTMNLMTTWNESLVIEMPRPKSTKPKKGFLDGYATYDTSQGFGSRQEWQNAFFERLGIDKAIEVLGENDPFVLFGLKPKATWSEINQAYRQLALKWHPDRNQHQAEEATAMMKKINAAYEVLEHRYGNGK